MKLLQSLMVMTLCLYITSACAEGNSEKTLQDMEAAAERVLQSGEQFKAELKRAREERLRLQKRQEFDRLKEAQRERQKAEEDAARLSALKNARERKALELAQEKSKREARARAEQEELTRQKELEVAQVNELAAHQALLSSEELSREERMARARAALAQAKSEISRQPKAFEDGRKSEQDLIMEKAARAQAALLQIRLETAPTAFE
ncbi:MAG: hypothetical protein HXY27_03685 [Hydrogenophilaceae bacterium]|nr:hypothetical protein [Hydrogenophilaceae bacterium]